MRQNGRGKPNAISAVRILFACLCLIFLPAAHAGTNIASDKPHAWSANSGWINLRGDITNGVLVGDSFLSGHAWSGNAGWIQFGDGTPANLHTYSNASAADFGVNHDGAGNLSGLAYGANIGWINFGWASANDPNRPRFSLVTGDFSGYAWSANTGWIDLGTGNLRAESVLYADADGDGISDAWEQQQFGNTSSASVTSDADGDGVSDKNEFLGGSDPHDVSSYLRIVSYREMPGLVQSQIEFTSKPTRLYRLEWSTDLVSWAVVPALGTFTPSAGATTIKLVTHPAEERRFFKAVAIVPLTP